MFIVLLRFSSNKGQAGQFMADHNAWIKRGFDDGVFLLVGSLQPGSGGGIMAHDTSLSDLQMRVNDDPLSPKSLSAPKLLKLRHQKPINDWIFCSAEQ